MQKHISKKNSIIIMLSVIFFTGCIYSSNDFTKTSRKKFQQKEWDKSVIHFTKAVKKDPDNPELKLLLKHSKRNASMSHQQKGLKLMERKSYDEAIKEFQISIAYKANNINSINLMRKASLFKFSDKYYIKGLNYLKEKKYIQAKDAFLKSYKFNPDNKKAKEFLDLYKAKKDDRRNYLLKYKSKKTISLKFIKTPLFNVFNILSKLSGINFIFDKDVHESKVTLFMVDISYDIFLKTLLKTHNLAAKVINEKTMLVYPNSILKKRDYDDLKIQTFYLSYLNSKSMSKILSRILKGKTVITNDKINAIIVRGTKETLKVASKIIKANDKAAGEILLNVEILEVNRTKEKELGLDLEPDILQIGIGTSDPDAKIQPFLSQFALKNISSKDIIYSLPTAIIHLLKQDSETKTLAKPQIRVKNRAKALIHIGERVPLRTNRRVDTTGNVTYDYQYQDIGVKLEAEPVINMHGEITLKINLEVSALGRNVGSVTDPQFSIKTRKAKSVLTVSHKEPIIIGGLLSNDETETVRKIPILGDIPLLGKLFTKYGTNKIETDILMTITPYIIRMQDAENIEETQFWSGHEKEFFTKEPYESYIKRERKYKKHPNQKLLEKYNISKEIIKK